MYEQAWNTSNTDALSSKRLLLILSLSIFIHIIIIFIFSFIITPTRQESFPKIAPITVNLERAKEILEQPKENSRQVEREIPVIKEETTRPIGSDQEKFNPPILTIDNPDKTITPDDDSSSEFVQLNSRDLILLSRKFIDRELDERRLSEEKNREMWMKSPSIVFGEPPKFFEKQEEIVSHEIEIIRDAINKAMTFPDCRTAYAGFGLLAIPILIGDAFTKYGCRW